MAALFWARWIEKERRCKIFILVSFLMLSLVMFLFTAINSVRSFLILSVLLSFFYVAHVRARSALIEETFPNSEWTGGVAKHSLIVGLSGVIGLLVGTLWTAKWDNKSLMLLCSFLVLMSLVLSILFIRDPIFIFEKKIVRWERFVQLADAASSLIYSPINYASTAEKKYLNSFPRPKMLIVGIFLFPLASTLVSTSLPIFLSVKMGVSSSLIFLILLI